MQDDSGASRRPAACRAESRALGGAESQGRLRCYRFRAPPPSRASQVPFGEHLDRTGLVAPRSEAVRDPRAVYCATVPLCHRFAGAIVLEFFLSPAENTEGTSAAVKGIFVARRAARPGQGAGNCLTV